MMSKFAMALFALGLTVGLATAAAGCEDDPRDLDHLKKQSPGANNTATAGTDTPDDTTNTPMDDMNQMQGGTGG